MLFVVGAGQTGLQVAARFNRMGIPTLIIDKNNRVGDNWRKRYDTLALHTPKKHHPRQYLLRMLCIAIDFHSSSVPTVPIALAYLHPQRQAG